MGDSARDPAGRDHAADIREPLRYRPVPFMEDKAIGRHLRPEAGWHGPLGGQVDEMRLDLVAAPVKSGFAVPPPIQRPRNRDTFVGDQESIEIRIFSALAARPRAEGDHADQRFAEKPDRSLNQHRDLGVRPRAAQRQLASRLPADGGDLALAGVVGGLGEKAGGLLRSVEAHRVLGGDEVEPPLGATL